MQQEHTIFLILQYLEHILADLEKQIELAEMEEQAVEPASRIDSLRAERTRVQHLRLSLMGELTGIRVQD